MKIQLELNLPDDRVFLNFWNTQTFDDVTCQIIGGKLMLNQFDDEGNELTPKEITLDEFVTMVKARVEGMPE